MGLVFYHWYSLGKIRDKNHNLKKLSSIGFFNGLSSLTQMIAFSLTLVVYVVSIKRVASLLSAIYGATFLKRRMDNCKNYRICNNNYRIYTYSI